MSPFTPSASKASAGDTDREITIESPSVGSPPALTVRSFGLTDRGRVRPSNQDQFLVADLAKAMRIRQSSFPQAQHRYSDDEGHLFMVADGIGGAAGGEQASALAVDSIEDSLLNAIKWFFALRGPEKDTLVAEFQSALRRADDRIFEQANRQPQLRGMGTTLTLAYSMNAELFVVHVGDSRCYVQRGADLEQITRDHTLGQELVDRGVLSAAEAARSRLRHAITNAVGGGSPGVHADVHKVMLEPGDQLLLATDGLTTMVPDNEIAAILSAETEPADACRRLVEKANEAGGRDNITVVVARYQCA